MTRARSIALFSAIVLTAVAGGSYAGAADVVRKARFAVKAKFAKNAGKLDGLDSTAFALQADLAWGNLTGVPAGFADGTDADSGGDITGVTAGTGLSGGGASGTVTLDVDTAAIQERVDGTCAAGSDPLQERPLGEVEILGGLHE